MRMILDTRDNEAPITELFAYVSLDDKGNEGICATILENLGSTPLVTSKLRVAEQMKPIAAQLAQMAGQRVQLVRFVRADVIWQSNPAQ